MRSFFLFLSFLLVLFVQNCVFGKAPKAAQPTQAEIDAAMQAAESQGRIIKVVAGGINVPATMKEIASLPVIFRATISGVGYDVVVMSMDITPTGAKLAAGARFRVHDSQTDLYFGSNEIAVSGKSGFAGALPILESTLDGDFKEFAVPRLGNNFLMGLDKNSKLDFSCGAFKEFELSGQIKVSNLVALETADGKPASGPLAITFSGQHVGDWKDILISGKVSASGSPAAAFHSANYPDLGFQFTGSDQAQIDLSDFRNPDGVPSCAQVSGAAWQGIAFPSFRVRLPAFFKLRPGVTLGSASGSNLFLDGKGLVGSVVAENVFSLAQGYTDELNKFDMSLSKLSADYSCNGQVTASMLGQIALPWCGGGSPAAGPPDAPMLWYSFRYINGHYESFVKDSERGQFASDRYKLSTGSEMRFALTPGELDIQATHNQKPGISASVFNNSICREFPATLTASGCEGKELVWSTGAIGAAIQVKPLETTTYWVKCRDKYCVAASSDSLKITVYESLPKPTLTAGRDVICSYESTDLRAENCVGIMEWKIPGVAAFAAGGSGDLVRNVSFSGQPGDYSYAVRCNLNGCYSPEATKTVRVLAEPQMPALYSNAPNNTIDRNGRVTLSGSCTGGDRLVWENLGQANLPNPAVTLASTATYRAVCRNDQTGCQSKTSASITINVLYLPPAAPSDLAFSNVATGSLTLSWKDNAYNEDGYTVLRSSSPDFSNPQTIGQVGMGVTSINDSGLSEGVTYYYQVIAHNKYDQAASERASQRTLVKPSAPVLSAENMSIVKGGMANVYGTCPSGALVWTVPVGFGGGQRQQNENTTYWAKCVNQGVEGPGASITVSVYTPAPNMPHLSVSSANIVKGSAATVNGYCDSGTLVWTVPVGFSGGERVQAENTTYWAKCVNEGGESPGASVTVSVYTPAPNLPHLSASATNIEKGSRANVTGYCDTGTLVWTVPVGFTGGERVQNENTTYWAKCVNEGGEGPGASITVNVYDRPCPPPSALWVAVDDITITNGNWGTLTAQGCEGGSLQWSNGSTDRSIGVNQGGQYSVTCTVRNDCGSATSSDGANVNVQNAPCNPPSAPWVAVDDITITNGSWGTLTAQGCEGGSLQWSNGSTDRSIGVNQGGQYSVTCTVRNDCGSASSSDGGTVNVQNAPCNPPSAPWVAVDDITITNGSWGTLTAQGCEGGSLQWSNGSTDRSIGVNQGGQYSVTCTVRNDCGSTTSSDGANVTVQNAPCNPPSAPWVAVDDISITSGSWGTLTAQGCDGGSLQWSNGSTDRSIGVNQGGQYSVTCTVRNDCGSATSSDGANVTIQNAPCSPPSAPWVAVDDITITNGSWGTLTAQGCDGGSLQWSNGSTDRSIGVNQGGQYSVTCTVRNDCGSASSSDGGNVTIRNCPGAPQITVPNVTMSGFNTATLVAYGCNGGSVRWNTGQTGDRIQTSQTGTYTAYCSVNTECGVVESSASGTLSICIAGTPIFRVNGSGTFSDQINVTNGASVNIDASCTFGNIEWLEGGPGTFNASGTRTFRVRCGDSESCKGSEKQFRVVADAPPVVSACDLNLNSIGGDAGFSGDYTMFESGKITFGFMASAKPDQLIITVNGREAINSGCISMGNNGVYEASVSFSQGDQISIRVRPNCTGTNDTWWKLFSSCQYNTSAAPRLPVQIGSNFDPETTNQYFSDKIKVPTLE
ncbi:fibronectin type III domain-containing protein [Dyadobacter jiangsuensis]|uniref:Fibronectin type-III domain-containing protein n=1 Tax=Dyadobacter jiangsuensis TaxID=1591085 RepID=A0A2P8FPK7_9BACT|nr:fibronectin type III domain-containing protein [Dyadobacter jiangsuensis]PSL23629.1 hypothetical protein CLV60_116186 [Dyadobacter jiangsuensis]